MLDEPSMIQIRPVLIGQPNGHHLHKAALDGRLEIGMRLDPVNDCDVIGLMGMAIQENRNTL